MPQNTKGPLTAKQLASVLHLKLSDVLKGVEAGEIPFRRILGNLYFDLNEVWASSKSESNAARKDSRPSGGLNAIAGRPGRRRKYPESTVAEVWKHRSKPMTKQQVAIKTGLAYETVKTILRNYPNPAGGKSISPPGQSPNLHFDQ